MGVPVTAVARLKAAPGQEEGVRLQALSLVEPTLAEPGCLFYRPFQDPLDPGAWVVVERWASRAEFDAHLAAPHMVEAFAAGATLLAAPPELQLLTDLA
ncbi:putative quinol monooxygenase [Kitasatospora sp. NPDC096147]|uniref:putative quinol monooxygenase n=1 Tax=Kitasatospora sp. NPDC096147 TaxID=3364093 RepID=UPI00381E020D